MTESPPVDTATAVGECVPLDPSGKNLANWSLPKFLPIRKDLHRRRRRRRRVFSRMSATFWSPALPWSTWKVTPSIFSRAQRVSFGPQNSEFTPD